MSSSVPSKTFIPTPATTSAPVNEPLKQDAKNVKAGSEKIAQAGKNAAEHVKPEAEKLKNKGKETLGSAADTVDAVADAAQGQAGKVKDGAQQAAGGVWSGIKKPFNYAGSKISGTAANLTTPRPNERFSPLWGAALLVGGVALFAAATAASWSATLFITTPALGLSLATLGMLSLAWTIGARIFSGAPAPISDKGTVNPKSRPHRTATEFNSTLDKEVAAVEKELQGLEKKLSKLSESLENTNKKAAEIETLRASLIIERQQLDTLRVAPVAAATVTAAEASSTAGTPDITPAVVVPTTTTSETNQGKESSVTPEVGENVIDMEKVKAKYNAKTANS